MASAPGGAAWAQLRRSVEDALREVDRRLLAAGLVFVGLVVAWAVWPVADMAPPALPRRSEGAPTVAVRSAPLEPVAPVAAPVVAPAPANAPRHAAERDLVGVLAPGCYAPALGLSADDGLRADVDPTTGLVTIFETDLDLGGVALRRARTSGDDAPGAFGAGWRAEHEARVRPIDLGQLVVHRLQGLSVFEPLTGDVFVSVRGEVEHLRRTAGGYELVEATGRLLRFDAAGDLVEVSPGYRVERAPGRVRLVDGATSVTLALDRRGLVSRVEGAASLRYEHDARGELVAVRGLVERDYQLDGGRVVAVRSGAHELLGARHDLDGRVAELWVPGWRQTYEAGVDEERGEGVLVMTSPAGAWRYATGPDAWVVTTPRGVEQVWFDDRGRPVAAQAPGAARPVARAFDALGRGAPLAAAGHEGRRLPGGAVVHEERDARGRVVAVTTVTTPPVRETFQWDALGRLVASTAPDGRVTRWEYGPDDLGGPILAEVGPAGRTAYAWVGERLARVGTPNGRSWWFEWSDGQLRSTQGPAGRTTYARDVAGRPLVRVDASGRELRYAYDAHGRPARLEADGPAGAARLAWTWDDDGDLVRAAGPEGALERVREGDGVDVIVDEASGVRLRARVTARREVLESPWGTFAREHDEQGRVVALESPAGVFRFGYDAQGQRVALAYPNGVMSLVEHDDLGRPVSVSVRGHADAPVLDLRHTFSSRHERARTTRDGAATSFEYDAAGRLVAAGGRTWRFDADGNRTLGGDEVATFDIFGRLEARGHDRAQHDAAGRLVRLGDDAFEYDALGRLARVRRAGRAEVRYAWDALGRLAARTEAGRTTRYVWDDSRLLAELGEGGALERLWVYGPELDEPLAYRDGPEGPWCFLHADDLGHVLAYSGPDGQRVDRVAFDPWGELARAPSAPRPLFFAGRLYDATAGLVLTRARPYDPALGRFLVPDPSGLLGGTNAYAYVSGNPVEFTDPLGLWAVPGWARRSGAWLGDRWSDGRAAVVDAAVGLGHLTGLTGTAEEQRLARERAQSRSLGAVDGFTSFMTFDLWDPNVSRWAYDQDLARDSRVYGEALGLGLSLASGAGAIRALPAVVMRGGRAVPGLLRAAPGALQAAPARLARAPAAAREALARAPGWLRENAGPLARATAAYLRDEALAPLRPLLRGATGALRSGVTALDAARSRVAAALREAREARDAATASARVDPAAARGVTAADDAGRGAQDGLAQAVDADTARGSGAAERLARSGERTSRQPSGRPPRRRPADPVDEPAASLGPWRGRPTIDDGDLRRGWRHIEARHVTGAHPAGAGDLFAPGTTREQLEQAAREVVERGVRQSDPGQARQVFERRLRINGRVDNVRVVVDSSDGRVVTMFPIRGGSH